MAFNLDPSTVKDSDFGPIPDGKYTAQIVKVDDEAKVSQKGDKYEQVNIQFRLVGGDFDNRRVFRAYIYNHETSDIAGEIGRQGLKQVWSALGSEGPSVTVESLDRQDVLVTIGLRTKDGNNGYGPRQEVSFVAKSSETAESVTSDAGSGSGSEWDL